MINLLSVDEVKALKANLRASFETEAGKEVMRFLEAYCGWYDFNEMDKDRIMIGHGKRQVLASIKTLLKLTPEEIVALANVRGV